MSVKETIDKALMNPDMCLLGQIIVSKEEYEELICYSQKKVQSILPRTIMPADIYLSVALVQIAIKKYSDGNYWDYFKSEIGLPYLSSSRTNLVGQVFVSTLKKYHLFPHNIHSLYIQ